MARKGTGKAVPWLEAHVNHRSKECLFWPFSMGPGYGQFRHNGVYYYAHRFMCELVNGPPPSPLHQTAHSCGNGRKGCVNPLHLSWKTNGENQLDRRQHGTKNKGGRGGIGKITPEQDELIRALAGTKTRMELAAMFGVTHSTIQYRLYGGSYRPRRERLKGAKNPPSI